MRSHSDRPPGGDHLWGAVGGMSLIEAIIYIALLSCLLSGFISYAYAIHQQDQSLFDDIEAAESS